MGLLFIIMNPTFRIILIVILISSVIFLPALMGASIIESPEEDDATDTDGDDFSFISQFSVFWTKIPVHQLSTLLRLGISIFTLFIVYLGGRSKHRRFNDRTIDHVIALKAELLKTALDRAVLISCSSFPQTLQRHILSVYLFKPRFPI